MKENNSMVPRGLEPRTLRLLAVRSNQLSYETTGAHSHALYLAKLANVYLPLGHVSRNENCKRKREKNQTTATRQEKKETANLPCPPSFSLSLFLSPLFPLSLSPLSPLPPSPPPPASPSLHPPERGHKQATSAHPPPRHLQRRGDASARRVERSRL